MGSGVALQLNCQLTRSINRPLLRIRGVFNENWKFTFIFRRSFSQAPVKEIPPIFPIRVDPLTDQLLYRSKLFSKRNTRFMF